jgi:hypothetical protein
VTCERRPGTRARPPVRAAEPPMQRRQGRRAHAPAPGRSSAREPDRREPAAEVARGGTEVPHEVPHRRLQARGRVRGTTPRQKLPRADRTGARTTSRGSGCGARDPRGTEAAARRGSAVRRHDVPRPDSLAARATPRVTRLQRAMAQGAPHDVPTASRLAACARRRGTRLQRARHRVRRHESRGNRLQRARPPRGRTCSARGTGARTTSATGSAAPRRRGTRLQRARGPGCAATTSRARRLQRGRTPPRHERAAREAGCAARRPAQKLRRADPRARDCSARGTARRHDVPEAAGCSAARPRGTRLQRAMAQGAPHDVPRQVAATARSRGTTGGREARVRCAAPWGRWLRRCDPAARGARVRGPAVREPAVRPLPGQEDAARATPRPSVRRGGTGARALPGQVAARTDPAARGCAREVRGCE